MNATALANSAINKAITAARNNATLVQECFVPEGTGTVPFQDFGTVPAGTPAAEAKAIGASITSALSGLGKDLGSFDAPLISVPITLPKSVPVVGGMTIGEAKLNLSAIELESFSLDQIYLGAAGNAPSAGAGTSESTSATLNATLSGLGVRAGASVRASIDWLLFQDLLPKVDIAARLGLALDPKYVGVALGTGLNLTAVPTALAPGQPAYMAPTLPSGAALRSCGAEVGGLSLAVSQTTAQWLLGDVVAPLVEGVVPGLASQLCPILRPLVDGKLNTLIHAVAVPASLFVAQGSEANTAARLTRAETTFRQCEFFALIRAGEDMERQRQRKVKTEDQE